MKRLDSYKYNVLLVKDDVGKPKPCTRRMPEEGYWFGKEQIRDPEDVGQVTSKWQYSRDSALKMQDKDYKRLNKSALAHKATKPHVSEILHH